MALTRDQDEVLSDFLERAQQDRASPRETKALVAAGLVESNLRNLDYGDRDSLGPLQQRPSQGWKHATDPSLAAHDFLVAARKINSQGFHGSAGQLAQAVQRSAFPGRYDKRAAEAEQLLGGTARKATASTAPEGEGGDSTALAVQQLLAAQAAPQPPASAGLQAPAFSAAPTLPAGAASLTASAPVQQQSGVDSLLQAAATAADGAGASTTSPSATESPAAAAEGNVVVDPGANRPGVSLSPGIQKVARVIAGVHGAPIHIGTGTAHSKMTADGNVSEHYGGNAFDSPATGEKLTAMGADALLATARGEKVQWLRNDGSVQEVQVTAKNARELAASGGIFNVPYGQTRRIQIIANTHQGGDHTNHLHVGVTPLRRAA